MTPPTWLDAHGRRRPTLACWTCGREDSRRLVVNGDPAAPTAARLRAPEPRRANALRGRAQCETLPVWRAAFLRPPARLTTVRFTPEVGRVELNRHRVTFRTIPARLHAWLRRIDQWIAYANSVVEE
jgi:hypothetical protein